MATKKAPSKQKSQPGEAPIRHIRWTFTVSRPFIIRVLSLLAYTVGVVMVAVLVLHADERHSKAKNADTTVNMQAAPVQLAQNMYQVHACSDSINSISSYTYSAKYFFDLEQQGYHLAG